MKLYRALWPSGGTPTGSPGAPLEPLPRLRGGGGVGSNMNWSRIADDHHFFFFFPIAQEIPPYFFMRLYGFFHWWCDVACRTSNI